MASLVSMAGIQPYYPLNNEKLVELNFHHTKTYLCVPSFEILYAMRDNVKFSVGNKNCHRLQTGDSIKCSVALLNHAERYKDQREKNRYVIVQQCLVPVLLYLGFQNESVILLSY